MRTIGSSPTRYRVARTLLAAILALEVVWLAAARREAIASEEELAQRRAEWRTFESLRAGSDADAIARTQRELADAVDQRSLMMTTLSAAPSDAAGAQQPPVDRAELYFDLAAFVQRMNERARAAGVEVREAAGRFGFGASAASNAGDAERLDVYRQRLLIEALLNHLFAARPASLWSVRREARVEITRAIDSTPRLAPAIARDSAVSGTEVFVLAAGLTVRTPDVVDTRAFEITFVGTTSVCRSFLNALAQHEPWAVVRALDVQPLPDVEGKLSPADAVASRKSAASFVLSTTGEREPAGDISPRDDAVPLVNASRSKFTVTLEAVELTAAGSAAPTTL